MSAPFSPDADSGLAPDRRLLTDPMWQAADVGRPLPDEAHAVSVCLPCWQHVIAYEEGDRDLLDRFFTGYPRFCCHRYQQQLFDAAATKAVDGEAALVYPSVPSARRCLEFLRCNGVVGARVEEWSEAGLAMVFYPRDAHATARLYWRYCGEVIGSRRAAGVLAGLAGAEGRDAGSLDVPVVTAGEGSAARQTVRARLGSLSGEDPANVFLFPSGMAAMAAVQRVLTGLRPGLPTVQVDFPYVDVLKVQQEFGSGVHFNLWRGEADEHGLFELFRQGGLAGIYTEIPSNPLLRCIDLPRLHSEAGEAGVPVVVDDTVGTPVNLDVQSHADVVTTSLTKYFSGAGNVMAGCAIVSDSSPFAVALCRGLRQAEGESGGVSDPDAVVLELNSRDFPQRMSAINRTAARLVDHLRGKHGLTLHYPDLSEGSNYRRLMRDTDPGRGDVAPGGGGLFSMVFDDPRRAPEFFDALRVSKGPSLGTNFTLACPYTLLAHYGELEWAEACGVARHLVRISVGLESAEDLCRRFDEALAAAHI